MNDLISIIVPVYNAENTIEKTVRCLQEQDYPYIEIILVNDGSTDNSKEICEKIKEIDVRVVLYTKKNGGPSEARQYGLDHANGQYVAFCDADDVMEKTMISTLLSLVNQDESQLSICSFNTGEDSSTSLDGAEEIWDQMEAMKHCLTDNAVGGFLWNKIFDLKIIKQYNIRFDETVYYCEDMEFVIEYLLHCTKISYVRKRLYNYIYQEGSLSSEKFSWKKLTNIFARIKILELLNNAKLCEVIPLAQKELVLQSVYGGRSIEEASHAEIVKITDEQFQEITDAIKQTCNQYGRNVVIHENCSIKDKVNIIRFGFFKKWKKK